MGSIRRCWFRGQFVSSVFFVGFFFVALGFHGLVAVEAWGAVDFMACLVRVSVSRVASLSPHELRGG